MRLSISLSAVAHSASRRVPRKSLLALLVLLAAGGQAHAVRDALVDQAAEHLRNKDNKAAYRLLSPMEVERAGDPDFDLVLGIAARLTENYTLAILALERVLDTQPENYRAKVELASAYFAVRDADAARQLLTNARAQGVPSDIAQEIDYFVRTLDNIAAREASNDALRWGGHTTLSFGRDSNATGGPTNPTIVVPAIGNLPFQLNPDAQASGSKFGTIGAGLSARYILSPELSWLGGIDYGRRIYTESPADTLSPESISLGTGINYHHERHDFNLTAQFASQRQDGVSSQASQALTGAWVYNIDGFKQFSTYLQRAHRENKLNPGFKNLYLGYGMSLNSTSRDNAGTVSIGFFGGEDTPAGSAPATQGYAQLGVRLGFSYPVTPDISAYASVSETQNDYTAISPLFLVARQDAIRSVDLGLNWSPAKKWRITPAISFGKTRSNIGLYTTKRKSFSLTARRDY